MWILTLLVVGVASVHAAEPASLADADHTWLGESAGDLAGWRLSAGADLDGDDVVDIAVGAPNKAAAAYLSSGHATVVSGADPGGRLTSAALSVESDDGLLGLGQVVASGADVTGDGFGDVALAPSGDVEPYAFPPVWIFSGPGYDHCTVADADASISSWHSGFRPLGHEVVVGPDLDADGHGDVVLGPVGPPTPVWGDASSPVWLAMLAGPVEGDTTIEDAAATITSDLGWPSRQQIAIAVGDIDGDGVDDLAWGAPGLRRAYVVLGPLEGERLAADADTIARDDGFGVASPGARALGSRLALGDFDGDGAVDLAIGASGPGDRGSWDVLLGPFDAEVSTDSAAFSLRQGNRAGDLGSPDAGAAVCDVDGDGTDDLVLGSPALEWESAPGQLALFAGPLVGSSTWEDADRRWLGAGAGAHAGSSIDCADFDGDGTDDVVVGAPGNTWRRGQVDVLLGPL